MNANTVRSLKTGQYVTAPSVPATVAELLENTFEQAAPYGLATPCRIWKGRPGSHGYGQIERRVDGKRFVATTHRAMFSALHGPVPDGLHVCHKCDVHLCIAQDHLFSGTRLQNMQDAAAKGRMSTVPRFSRDTHPNAKLNSVEASWLCRICATKKLSINAVSRIFKINRSTVLRITKAGLVTP